MPRIVTLCATALLCVLFVFPMAAAGAQEDCYPDGCTEPTNPAPAPSKSCGISLSTAQVGATVTATVTNVPEGGTVRIMFDGSVVASNADDEQSLSVGGPLFARSAPARQTSSDVVLDFTVPDVPPGTYSVTAVGADFTVTCGDGDGNTDFQVLAGNSLPRTDADGNNGSGHVGPLPFTGLEVGVLVLLAIALIGAGWYALRRSKSRRLTA